MTISSARSLLVPCAFTSINRPEGEQERGQSERERESDESARHSLGLVERIAEDEGEQIRE
jgi:hypothetical protein